MEAYEQQSACVAAVVKLLQSQKEENWSLPLMYSTSLDLRLVAQKAEGCNCKNLLYLYILDFGMQLGTTDNFVTKTDA